MNVILGTVTADMHVAAIAVDLPHSYHLELHRSKRAQGFFQRQVCI